MRVPQVVQCRQRSTRDSRRAPPDRGLRDAGVRGTETARRAPAVPVADPADPGPRPGHTDRGVGALASALADAAQQERLRTIATAVARKRYGMRTDDAEDVYQASVLTYLLARGRYPADTNHFAILMGIFRHLAIASLEGSRRQVRCLEGLATRLAHERREFDPTRSPDAALMRAERDAAIRAAVSSLPLGDRDTLLSLADGGSRRLDLIARLGINRCTFDSRLHAARSRLRRRLTRCSGF